MGRFLRILTVAFSALLFAGSAVLWCRSAQEGRRSDECFCALKRTPTRSTWAGACTLNCRIYLAELTFRGSPTERRVFVESDSSWSIGFLLSTLSGEHQFGSFGWARGILQRSPGNGGYEDFAIISAPLWFVTILFATAPTVAGIRSIRTRLRPRAGRCATCGYDLRATTAERCPECGTTYDPVSA